MSNVCLFGFFDALKSSYTIELYLAGLCYKIMHYLVFSTDKIIKISEKVSSISLVLQIEFGKHIR